MSEMSCSCARCRVLARVPQPRDDPQAPLPFETWLRDHRDDWPFWLLGGLIVLIGVLLWTPGSMLTLLLLAVGAAVGSLPFLREHLDGCERVRASRHG